MNAHFQRAKTIDRLAQRVDRAAAPAVGRRQAEGAATKDPVQAALVRWAQESTFSKRDLVKMAGAE